MRTLKLSDIPDYDISLFQKLHESEESILIFDQIYDNMDFFEKNKYKNSFDTLIHIKKEYRLHYKNFFPRPISEEYVCIHIRYGDITNLAYRVLDVDYYISGYKYLSEKHDISRMPIFIITESNFKEKEKIIDEIPSCKFVQGDQIEAFYYLVNCSFLVASRSGFSNLAYIFGGMKVVRPPKDFFCYWDNII
jgi:hypothetical protein